MADDDIGLVKLSDLPARSTQKEAEVEEPVLKQTEKPLRSLGDIQSLENVQLDGEGEKVTDFILDEATRAKLKAQPQIGFWESARRNISSLGGDLSLIGQVAFEGTVGQVLTTMGLMDIPEEPAALRILKRLRGEPTKEQIPTPLRSPTLRLFALKESADRLTSDKYDGNIELKNRDIRAVSGYLAEKEEERIRGVSFGGKVSAAGLEIPSFMATFVATGGLATLGKKGVQKGISFALKRELESKTAIFVSKTIQTATGAALRTAASPHLVAKSFAERQLSAKIQPLDKGFTLLEESRETPATSMMKAFGDTFVEFFSEETGKAIGIVGSKFVPKRLLTSFGKVFGKLHPGESVKALATKVGWNGFLQELGEERVGDIMRASLGIDKFDPNSDRVMDQIMASWPNWEELGVEATVIGLTGAGVKGTAASIEFIQNRKKSEGFVEPKDREISDEEASSIAAKPVIEEKEKAVVPVAPLQTEAEILDILAGKKPVPQGIPLEVFAEIVKDRKARAEVKAPKEKIKISPEEQVAVQKAKEKFPEREVIIEGRAKRLGEELTTLQKEGRLLAKTALEATEDVDLTLDKLKNGIEALQGERTELFDQFQSTESIDAQIKTLETEVGVLEKQKSKILQKLRADEKVLEGKVSIARKKFDEFLKAPKAEVRPSEKITVTPKSIISALSQRAKSAAKFAKGEAKIVQTQLIEALEKAKIPTKPFLRKIRDIQTIEQLNRELPEFEARIARAEETRDVRKQLSVMEKQLKSAKPISKSGKLVGKFTPEIQNALDTIRKAIQIKAEVVNGERINPAQELINKRIEDLGNMPPEVQFAQENAILDAFSDIKGKTSAELVALNEQIASFITEGRRLATGKRIAKKTEAEKNVEIAITAIQGGDPLLPTSERKKTLRKKLIVAYTQGKNSLSGYEDVIEVIDNTKTLEVATKNIAKLAKKGDKLSDEQLKGAKSDLSGLVDISPLSEPRKKALKEDIVSIKDAKQLASVNKDIGKKLSDLSIKGVFAKITSVVAEEQKEKGDVDRMAQKIVGAGFRAFGFKRQGQFARKMEADNRLTPEGNFGNMIDASGQTVLLHLTKSEARSIVMELADPTLNERIRSEGSGYQLGATHIKGLTQDMVDRIDSFLNEADVQWNKEKRKIYQEFYDKEVRPLYKKFYGIDPGSNPNYTPTSRVVGQQDVIDSFLQELNIRRTTAPGTLKSRTKTQAPLRVRSDIDVLTGYTFEMNHWLNWAEKDRTLQSIFGNSKVKSLISEKYGGDSLRVIEGYIQLFRTRGKDNARLRVASADFLRRNITRAALAGKISSVPKQMTSTLAFAENIPPLEFAIGILDFARNPIKNAKILDRLSDFVHTRGGSMDRDLKDIANSNAFSLYRGTQTLDNYLLMTTRLGDRWGILPGAWAVYRHTLKKTGSRKSAVAALEAKGSATQQSSDFSKLSKLQLLGSIGKLFTMFGSAQNQYLRREMSAIDGILRGKITVKQFAKTIAIYHFLLPMIFQWVSDFGRWDEDEQRRARWLGSLNGVFIFKDVLDALVRGGLNAFTDSELDQFRGGGVLPIGDIQEAIIRSMEALDKDKEEIKVEELLESFLKLIAGPSTGIPFKRLYDGYEGITDITDPDIFEEDKTAKGVLKILGWTPRTVEAGFKKKDEFEDLKDLFKE